MRRLTVIHILYRTASTGITSQDKSTNRAECRSAADTGPGVQPRVDLLIPATPKHAKALSSTASSKAAHILCQWILMASKWSWSKFRNLNTDKSERKLSIVQNSLVYFRFCCCCDSCELHSERPRSDLRRQGILPHILNFPKSSFFSLSSEFKDNGGNIWYVAKRFWFVRCWLSAIFLGLRN